MTEQATVSFSLVLSCLAGARMTSRQTGSVLRTRVCGEGLSGFPPWVVENTTSEKFASRNRSRILSGMGILVLFCNKKQEKKTVLISTIKYKLNVPAVCVSSGV